MKALRLLCAVLMLPAVSAGHPIPEEEIPRFGGCYFARVGLTPLWRMRDQDGAIREFEPHARHKDLLVGCGGWTATADGADKYTVKTPKNIEPHLVYHFQEGRLLEAEINGKRCRFGYPEPLVYENAKIVPLWPEASANATEAFQERMSRKWNFRDRLRLGFASPNQAGAVLAVAALIFLAGALGSKAVVMRILLSLGVVIFIVLMLMTASRGALVAAVSGALPLVICHVHNHREKTESSGANRPLNRKRLLFVGIGVFVFLVAMGGFAAHRMSSIDRKASNASRIELLRLTPRMFFDAPGGWGSRRDVGRAYTDWYQPPTVNKQMFSLVSDQLTNVVALGWFKGGAYVFVWIAGLLALWLVAWRGGTAIPAVAWTAFGVAAAFNVVLHTRYVSWIPFATLALLIQVRCLRNLKFWIWPCAIGLAGAVLVTSGMICVGKLVTIDAPRVTRISGGTVVNGQTSSNWLVADPDVLGLVTVKKEVRNFYEQMPNAPAIVYTEDLNTVPIKKNDRLILTGRRCASFLEQYSAGKITQLPHEIVFLAPPFGNSKVPLKLRAQCRVHLVIGEFAARYYEDYVHPQKWVTLVKGAEVYIPGWMRFCVGKF